jgi:hypothetical protein
VLQKLTIYPISLAPLWDADPFDSTALPFGILNDVAIEDVSQLISERSFAVFSHSDNLSQSQLKALSGVRYGIVHRYQTESKWLKDEEKDRASIDLVEKLAACLRIIRPTRATALLIQGDVEDWGFDASHFEHPIELMEVPEAQKLWSVRNRDAEMLRRLVPVFLEAYTSECMKFMMSVQFYQAGHFADLPLWKIRFFLWVTALEALFTTQDRQHNGKAVSVQRVKFFIGAKTPIYDAGDLTEWEEHPKTTVEGVIDDIYKLRNLIAHGSRVPETWFRPDRRGLNDEINYVGMLAEAVSSCVRSSLLRILGDNLLKHFKTARANEKYFAAANLTKDDIARLPP